LKYCLDISIDMQREGDPDKKRGATLVDTSFDIAIIASKS
jgi:hypothetical protein